MRCFLIFITRETLFWSEIKSRIIEELCKLLQISKSPTIPYHPQGDGLLERANRIVLNMLATVVKDHHDWKSCLRATCMAQVFSPLLGIHFYWQESKNSC